MLNRVEGRLGMTRFNFAASEMTQGSVFQSFSSRGTFPALKKKSHGTPPTDNVMKLDFLLPNNDSLLFCSYSLSVKAVWMHTKPTSWEELREEDTLTLLLKQVTQQRKVVIIFFLTN